MRENPEDLIEYRYTFNLQDGTEKAFDVQLDSKTLNMVQQERDDYPEWTQLSCNQCPNCPLSQEEHPRCPIAANMVELSDFFRETVSYEEVDVEIQTQDRRYTKRTSVQQSLSSLLGIYMVTSGCPVMDKLRPMVRFHLPFANLEETTYRALSMYLMAQFFILRNGGRPDWALQNLVRIYEDVQTVNQSFFKRLDQIANQDASTNALVILDTFANFVVFSIDESMLDDIEVLFQAYLRE